MSISLINDLDTGYKKGGSEDGSQFINKQQSLQEKRGTITMGYICEGDQ